MHSLAGCSEPPFDHESVLVITECACGGAAEQMDPVLGWYSGICFAFFALVCVSQVGPT